MTLTYIVHLVDVPDYISSPGFFNSCASRLQFLLFTTPGSHHGRDFSLSCGNSCLYRCINHSIDSKIFDQTPEQTFLSASIRMCLVGVNRVTFSWVSWNAPYEIYNANTNPNLQKSEVVCGWHALYFLPFLNSSPLQAKCVSAPSYCCHPSHWLGSFYLEGQTKIRLNVPRKNG